MSDCFENNLIIEVTTARSQLHCWALAARSAEGYVCDCAFDGREGANLLEEKRYDLVLLDLMLPEIGGYELLEYIHPMGIPAIVISAMGRVEDRIRGLRMGADDYLCALPRSASRWRGSSRCSGGRARPRRSSRSGT